MAVGLCAGLEALYLVRRQHHCTSCAWIWAGLHPLGWEAMRPSLVSPRGAGSSLLAEVTPRFT